MSPLHGLASGFVVLSLLTLLFVVVGFLNSETEDQEGAEELPSQSSLWVNAILASALGLFWAYWAYSDYLDGAEDWYWIAACAIMAALQFWQSLRLARRAYRIQCLA